MDLSYQELMSDAVKVFELVGVAILVVGSTLAFAGYALELVRRTPRLTAFKDLRASLGRSILLGLEVLVVADIVRTIVVEPTLESAADARRDRAGAGAAQLRDRRRGRRRRAVAQEGRAAGDG